MNNYKPHKSLEPKVTNFQGKIGSEDKKLFVFTHTLPSKVFSDEIFLTNKNLTYDLIIELLIYLPQDQMINASIMHIMYCSS